MGFDGASKTMIFRAFERAFSAVQNRGLGIVSPADFKPVVAEKPQIGVSQC